MKNSTIIQLKLTTCEEIICEVMEWPDEDEAEIVVRNVMEIISSSVTLSNAEGYKYYSFRPWMTLQEGDDVFLTINSNHVIGEGLPPKKVLEHYLKVIKSTNKILNDDAETKENLENWIERLRKDIQSMGIDPDADSSEIKNIITFPGSKDKLH